LHAVAVVKTGVFALLKVAVYIFGLEGMQLTGCSIPIAYVAGLTMVLASLIALRRDNLKERLAYSTIGQLAYIVCGTASGTTAGVVGAGMHMVTHAFGKITLFFAAGAILVAAHRSRISSMVGLGRSMPLTFVAFGIGALSIIGIPPLAGTWSKWWLGSGIVEAGQLPLLAALLFSSLLSAAYLLPIASRAFVTVTGVADADAAADTDTDAAAVDDAAADDAAAATAPLIHEAPWPCRVAMAVTAGACVVLLFLLGPLYELLVGIAG
jgi:multicomponent Na+:H+ antiporter subunit D